LTTFFVYQQQMTLHMTSANKRSKSCWRSRSVKSLKKKWKYLEQNDRFIKKFEMVTQIHVTLYV